MNENLNLVEILKDCPKGIKLYSTIFGDVKFNHVENDTYPIVLDVREGFTFRVSQDGRYLNDFSGECTLFPSKEQRDWSKFNPKKEGFVPTCEFKDGDILSYKCKSLQNRTIYIYRCRERVNTAYYVAISGGTDAELMIDNIGRWALNGYNDTARFATEEEKQKLFQAIKDNGYKWNAKTKTLEKLVKPKFDPKTLKPFDKVLVRRGSEDYNVWFPDFVSYSPDATNNKTLCMCVMEDIAMVIPYNDETKHLLGTSDEAPEYYRYWED